MRLILVAILLVACAIVAAAQDCGQNCNAVVKSPPSPLETCKAANSQLVLMVEQLGARVKAAEAEVDALKAKPKEPAKASSKPKKKTVKRSSRGCKPGRTRNAAGKCGRW